MHTLILAEMSSCVSSAAGRSRYIGAVGTEVARSSFRSVPQQAGQPREDEREQGEEAGDEQTHWAERGDAAVEVVHKDEAQKQQHHRGQDGEDGAHAARRERHLLARMAAVLALSGGCCGGDGCTRGMEVCGHTLFQRESLGHRGVVGEVVHPVLRHRSPVATHGATDPPSSTLPGVQRVQALPAEGVGAAQQFGGVDVQVEVVVAYFTFVILQGKRVCPRRAAVALSAHLLRHVVQTQLYYTTQ